MPPDDPDHIPSFSEELEGKAKASPGSAEATAPLFLPEEIDIYVKKLTNEVFFFHGKVIDYDAIERLDYDPADYSVTVVYKDGRQQDLGVKIQWLIRPYFQKAPEINIVRTKDGKSIDGVLVRVVHRKKEEKNAE